MRRNPSRLIPEKSAGSRWWKKNQASNSGCWQVYLNSIPGNVCSIQLFSEEFLVHWFFEQNSTSTVLFLSIWHLTSWTFSYLFVHLFFPDSKETYNDARDLWFCKAPLENVPSSTAHELGCPRVIGCKKKNRTVCICMGNTQQTPAEGKKTNGSSMYKFTS